MKLDAERSYTSEQIAPDVNLARIRFVADLIGRPDDVCGLMQKGGNIVGDIANTQVFRQIQRPSRMSRQELLDTSEAWISDILKSAPPKAEDAVIILGKKWRRHCKGSHERFLFQKPNGRQVGQMPDSPSGK